MLFVLVLYAGLVVLACRVIQQLDSYERIRYVASRGGIASSAPLVSLTGLLVLLLATCTISVLWLLMSFFVRLATFDRNFERGVFVLQLVPVLRLKNVLLFMGLWAALAGLIILVHWAVVGVTVAEWQSEMFVVTNAVASAAVMPFITCFLL
jgi:hypothetical protein